MLIVGIIFCTLGIILTCIGIWKLKNAHTVNIKIDENNRQAQQLKEQLEKEINFYKQRKKEFERDSQNSFENYCDILELTYLAKENEYDSKINNLYKEYQRKKQRIDEECCRHKKEAEEAFEFYCEVLDDDYNLKEAEYENHYRCLKEIYNN